MLIVDDKVWIYNKNTDMRKSIDGLSRLVVSELGTNPTDGGVFVFWNRCHNKVKILYWHINGFCLVYKRLEKQRFCIPSKMPDTLIVSNKELRWLLDGLDFSNLSGHKKLKYEVFS